MILIIITNCPAKADASCALSRSSVLKSKERTENETSVSLILTKDWQCEPVNFLEKIFGRNSWSTPSGKNGSAVDGLGRPICRNVDQVSGVLRRNPSSYLVPVT